MIRKKYKKINNVIGYYRKLFAVTGMFWLVPLLLFAPRFINPSFSQKANIWDCAALFTRRAPRWGDIRLEVRNAKGWQEVALAEISSQGLAGYRQRMDRVMEEVVKRKKILNLTKPLGEHLEQLCEKAGYANIREVAVKKITFAAGSKEMVLHEGNWEELQQKTSLKGRGAAILWLMKTPDGWEEVSLSELNKSQPTLQNRRRVRIPPIMNNGVNMEDLGETFQ